MGRGSVILGRNSDPRFHVAVDERMVRVCEDLFHLIFSCSDQQQLEGHYLESLVPSLGIFGASI